MSKAIEAKPLQYKIMFFNATITVADTITLKELADKIEKYGKIVQFFRVKG